MKLVDNLNNNVSNVVDESDTLMGIECCVRKRMRVVQNNVDVRTVGFIFPNLIYVILI